MRTSSRGKVSGTARCRVPAAAAIARVLPFAVGALAVAACAPAGPPVGPRLVVLYSTCTLGTEYLAPYRAGIDFTPNLAAFARESVVFERHVTESGQSGVSFASLYTGTQADRHGVYFHPSRLSDDLLLAGEAFRDAGYETHFWSGQSLASAELGYGQGTDPANVRSTFVMFTKRAKALGEDFLARTTATGPELDALLARLTADPELHAYLQVNFTITHELYHEYSDLDAIERFRESFPAHATDLTRDEIAAELAFFEEHRHLLQLDHERARRELELDEEDVRRLDAVLRLAYRACVHQLDAYFGRFLGKLDDAGLLADSVIAFTADHGETFYHESEPLHWMHGLQLAPTVLDVPWMLRAPGLPPGRYAGVTRSIDVFPTLAGLCGAPLPRGEAGPEGVDLAPVLRSRGEPPALEAYSHTSTLGPDRIARYRRNGYGTVIALLPDPSPEHMWVRVRDGDLVWELRPRDPSRPPGEAARVLAFDLARDPTRTHDLFDATDPLHAEKARRLEAYRTRLVAAHVEGDLSQREVLRRLEGLGYVGSEDEDASASDAPDSPRAAELGIGGGR